MGSGVRRDQVGGGDESTDVPIFAWFRVKRKLKFSHISLQMKRPLVSQNQKEKRGERGQTHVSGDRSPSFSRTIKKWMGIPSSSSSCMGANTINLKPWATDEASMEREGQTDWQINSIFSLSVGIFLLWSQLTPSALLRTTRVHLGPQNERNGFEEHETGCQLGAPPARSVQPRATLPARCRVRSSCLPDSPTTQCQSLGSSMLGVKVERVLMRTWFKPNAASLTGAGPEGAESSVVDAGSVLGLSEARYGQMKELRKGQKREKR